MKQITAVLDTLRDIIASIENEEREEAANYQKFMAWCNSEVRSLNQSLTEAQDENEANDVTGKELAATVANLEKELADIAKSIQETKDIMAQAESVRGGEADRYNDDMQMNRESIDQVARAISIVGKVHGQGGFLQNGILQHLQLNEPGESSYVLGIMKGIKEKLEKTRAELEAEEQKRKGEHDAFMQAKKKELSSLQGESSQKKLTLTSNRIQQVEVNRILKESAKKIEDFTSLRQHTVSHCDEKDVAFQARKKDRTQEKEALHEAVEYIAQAPANTTSEDAMLQSSTFLQLRQSLDKESASMGSATEDAAPTLLQVRAQTQGHASHGAPRLWEKDTPVRAKGLLRGVPSATAFVSQLAGASPTAGSLGNAKGMVNKLISLLEQQQRDEEGKAKHCRAELAGKEHENATIADELNELSAAIEYKDGEISTLESEVSGIRGDIATMDAGLKEAAALRKQEKATYEAGKKDRSLAVRVLKQAIQVIGQFYATEDKTGLLQHGAIRSFAGISKIAKPSPATWSGSARKAIQGRTAIAMMEKVAQEINKEQAEAAKEERDAANAHEQLQQDSRAEFDRLMQEITERVKRKAKLVVQVNTDKETASQRKSDIEAVQEQLRTLHEECDELLSNLEERTKSRSFEVSQLKDVIDILSGSQIASRTGFLEQPSTLNDREAALLQDMSRALSTAAPTA